MTERVYPLPQGRLSLTLRNDARAQDYFSVVARDNPRRAFLFFSKLLGKHIPVAPSAMRDTHRQLAAQLVACTADHGLGADAPYLFVGMAETATALSQGTYEAWLSQRQSLQKSLQKSLPQSPQKSEAQPAATSVFVSTTRYYFPHRTRIDFEEGHSHAPAIGLYVPDDPTLRARFLSAKTLVVIDDEFSTGKTVIALLQALQAHGVPIARVITVALTDFSGEHIADFDCAIAPVTATRVSLLQGQWAYHHTDSQPLTARDLNSAQSDKQIVLPASVTAFDPMSRLGSAHALTLSEAVKSRCRDLLAALPPSTPRLLILGTGEYMYPPFCIAHYLESLGADVAFCATTRSPIKVWGDIQHRHCWRDPYGEGVNNYLYNYRREDYDDVWLISELPSNDALRETATQLNARLFCFVQEDQFEDGFIH